MADLSALRGYDSYMVTLGDEMRGRRATLGKSLLDVQRDLRIRASHVEAIENADPRGLPYAGFVTGYVRAYARYLGMDEDDALRRFCMEAGCAPQAGPRAKARSAPRARSAGVATPRADLDAVIVRSRLAAASRAEALAADLGSTLRAAGSLAVLVLLIAGVGYGGWAVLRNIQQVELAPSSEAPAALAEAPGLAARPQIAHAALGPVPAIDADALAAIYAAQEAEPPRIEPRDGPIAALDPARSGVYASLAAPTPVRLIAAKPEEAPAPLAAAGEEDATKAVQAEEAPAPGPARRSVALLFEGDVWVRVRGAHGETVYEALASAGARWEAPEDAELTLRAGNAGSLFVEVDGVRRGPLGRSGQVIAGVPLNAEALREAYPLADRSVMAEAAR